MYAETERPASCGERTGRKYKTKYFRHTQYITGQNNLKTNPHWSRHTEQLRKDACLLALFGLYYEDVSGTTFHQLGGNWGQYGR